MEAEVSSYCTGRENCEIVTITNQKWLPSSGMKSDKRGTITCGGRIGAPIRGRGSFKLEMDD